MSTCKFTCSIENSNTSCPLGVEIWLNEQQIFNTEHVNTKINFEYDINDDIEGQQSLRWVLKNKLPEHTKIDSDGNILSDAYITVSDVTFEEIECQTVVKMLANYSHNFNGTGADTVDKFYGSMGCNGTVELKFETPVYMWLLDNM